MSNYNVYASSSGLMKVLTKTSAQWAVDTTIYSNEYFLVSSDVVYPGASQQRKFKTANGIDTWNDLDYVPAGINLYTEDGTLISEREVTMMNNSLNFTAGSASLNFTSSTDGSITSSTDTGNAFSGSTNSGVAGSFLSQDGNAIEATSTNTDAVSVSAPNGYGVFSDSYSGIASVGQTSGFTGASIAGNGGTFSTDTGNAVELNATTGVAIMATSGINTGMILRGSAFIETHGLGESFESSAVMKIASKTQGLLPPVMTTAQRTAIASPATGLMVFDSTTGTDWKFNGTNWFEI